MWYVIAGFLAGALLNIVPLFQPAGGVELYPEWYGKLEAPERIEKSPDAALGKIGLPPVKLPGAIAILTGDGNLRLLRNTAGKLYAVSGNGQYYASYEKTGSKIEFQNIQGEPFWNISSREYPYLSYNGKLILLVSSDHSNIRPMDFHGNIRADSLVFGRFATVISFSGRSDYAGAGFLDGSYYFLDASGKILQSGRVADNALVKSIAVGNNGKYAAVHSGSEKGDFIDIIALESGKQYRCPLQRVHPTRTALYISEEGDVTALDYDKILLISRKGKIRETVKVPPAKPGLASIVSDGRLYAASYTKREGDARFLIFRGDGTVVFSREFSGESFLDTSLEKNLILLRGSQGLYCYSFSHPGLQ